mmetsp:Transcript_30561/g.88867  ORF Transcript_30561/g.88867 Transcript_30561/m.88867 type:complete len:390 (+) Transcript_30561:511-1680(+)
MASEGDFPRPRRVAADQPSGQERRQGDSGREACRRAVLCDGARWEVHMQVDVREGRRQHAYVALHVVAWRLVERLGLQDGECGSHGLLHDLAQLSRHNQTAAPLHFAGLDEENVAARRVDGETDGNARSGQPVGNAQRVFLVAEYVDQVFLLHADDRLRCCCCGWRWWFRCRSCVAIGGLQSRPTADGGNASIKLTNAALGRVLADDLLDDLWADLQSGLAVLIGEPVCVQVVGNEVPLGNPLLLMHRVARDVDDFQSVPESSRHGGERVGRADEEHPGEVVRNSEVVVREFVVLLGVEHFEKGCGGIVQGVAVRQLVNFIEQQHGIPHTCVDHGLHNDPWQRTDVSASMAADLRLVADTTQRNPVELTTKCLCHRRRERCLADARRAR